MASVHFDNIFTNIEDGARRGTIPTLPSYASFLTAVSLAGTLAYAQNSFALYCASSYAAERRTRYKYALKSSVFIVVPHIMGILALFALVFQLLGTRKALPALHASELASAVRVLPCAESTIPITSKVPRRDSRNHALSVLRGSSDTWVVHKDFACFDLDGNSLPAATCEFGPAQFDPAASPTFQLYPNVTFLVRYQSAESMSGPVGFDTVTDGGLSIDHQQIGVPNHNAFLGDGVSEGVFGLAFPQLTSVWNTTSPQNASRANHILYNPFFFNAVQQKKINSPLFSISLDRPTFEHQVNESFDPNLGFLAFGGPVPVSVTSTAVTVPIQRYAPNDAHIFVPSNAPNAIYTYYTVDIDDNTGLDSGTTLNWVPTAVAAACNAQFHPPAVLDPGSGMYVVECNATAPPFAAVIGGMSFRVDPRDQIMPKKNADGNVVCFSGTQDGGLDVPGNLFALGDAFLHNVMVTHNPVDGEVTLAQRAPYYSQLPLNPYPLVDTSGYGLLELMGSKGG
ncbi:aspartic peptidase domain-containing protein [Mycena latifolia]|nr:aspartic peptidase domain-containing protein [Mycena latifolia]